MKQFLSKIQRMMPKPLREFTDRTSTFYEAVKKARKLNNDAYPHHIQSPQSGLSRSEAVFVHETYEQARAGGVTVAFFMIPFIGYSVIPASYFFPQLLPSPMQTRAQQELLRDKELLHMDKGYSGLLRLLPPQANTWDTMLENIRFFPLFHAADGHVDVRYRGVFELHDEHWRYARDSIPIPKLLPSQYLPRDWCARQVCRHYEFILRDDQMLRQEGVMDAMTDDELRRACVKRGMHNSVLSTREAQEEQLLRWLEMTKQHFFVTERVMGDRKKTIVDDKRYSAAVVYAPPLLHSDQFQSKPVEVDV